jgi:hypothetical protein
LEGSKWKSIGIVDIESGLLRELEPKDCEECFTLEFYTDTDISTYTAANIGLGLYNVDYVTCAVSFANISYTMVMERPDSDWRLWDRTLLAIESFSLHENELKLYYDGNSNYLLMKRIFI